ncbi:MAG: diguanylate cyclase [Gemmatimonadetes bacterium]|nr:diguanylate cyclase [Gemmatimonadota bacterium]
MAATYAIDAKACVACHACVRVCPTDAVVVLGDGEFRIEQEQCIGCGQCAPACHHDAIRVEGDRAQAEEAAAAGNAILILGTEADVFFHPATFEQIVNACRALGYRQVYSSALGDELVAREYLKIWGALNSGTVVRSTDPVSVDYIRRRFPELLGVLAPVATPAAAAARYLRAAYAPEPMFAVFAGPGGMGAPDGEREIDATITLQDLAGMLQEHGIDPLRMPRELTSLPQERRRHLSVPGGLPLPMLAGERLNSLRVRRVRGLSEVAAVARAVADGEALGFVDVMAWDGSLGHPSMGPAEELFVRRRIARAVEPPRSPRPVVDEAIPVDLRVEHGPAGNGVAPPASEIESILEQIGTGPNGKPWDSGACGYATCLEFAGAVSRGRATLLMCPQALRRRADEAERLAAYDALTGLHTYRVFQERLGAEAARIRRTGARVSLIVLDLDAFKHVNDRRGHEAGNRVLRAVGAAIAGSVRKSDFAARYGGDEFVALLTDADAEGARLVAEKMRESIAGVEPPPGPPPPVRITASFGIATFSGRAERTLDPVDFFQAADRAVYEAKRRGGNMIVLAREYT